MPIEDVHYLKTNSIRQSYIFLVDSGDRDRVAYPTPSEYAINFATPFHNVVGFEVLDASIPRTMYNIGGGDSRYPTNNTIAFYIHDGTSNVSPAPSAYVTRSIDPGDYTIQTLIAQINGSLTMQMRVNNDSNMPLAAITVESVSNPPDVRNLLRFKCPYPFFFDMSRSAIAESLGFDLYVEAAEEAKPRKDKRYTVLPYADSNAMPNPKLYHSVDLTPVEGLGDTAVVYSGPRGIVRNLPLSSNTWVAQSFVVATKCILSGVGVALTTSSKQVEGNATWELWSSSNTAPYAKIPLANTHGLLDTDYVDGGFTVTTTVRSMTDPGFAKLDPGTYWIVVSSSVTTPRMGVYYNDVQPSQGASVGQRMLVTTDQGDTYTTMNDSITGLEFIASMEVSVQYEYHQIVAPGIWSLLGERFTVLRCKEIEENSYRSLAYSSHCLGLAKFRLGVMGVSDNRLDFSKVPLREFHPIGKLGRLSFRFETASGLLYDFKGVNHTITFAIYYLEPVQKNNFTRSLLNPNYTGEFMKDIHDGIYDEDEEDEYDEESLRHHQQIYRVRENRHLPENVNQMDLEALQRFALDDDDGDGDDRDDEVGTDDHLRYS